MPWTLYFIFPEYYASAFGTWHVIFLSDTEFSTIEVVFALNITFLIVYRQFKVNIKAMVLSMTWDAIKQTWMKLKRHSIGGNLEELEPLHSYRSQQNIWSTMSYVPAQKLKYMSKWVLYHERGQGEKSYECANSNKSSTCQAIQPKLRIQTSVFIQGRTTLFVNPISNREWRT